MVIIIRIIKFAELQNYGPVDSASGCADFWSALDVKNSSISANVLFSVSGISQYMYTNPAEQHTDTA